jgi:hypothetical protein
LSWASQEYLQPWYSYLHLLYSWGHYRATMLGLFVEMGSC